MNIFVTSFSPKESAIVLPDKHINKMPLESCQMLAIVASKWYHNYGNLLKKDGNPYKTERGAFRNHPCTIWVSKSIHNSQWLIEHGLELCEEFNYRFKKVHSCYFTLKKARAIFPKGDIKKVTPFARAMPDEFKYDNSIDTFTAYKKYIISKIWTKNDYKNAPERKPEWMFQ
jgi:hypothetical protein